MVLQRGVCAVARLGLAALLLLGLRRAAALGRQLSGAGRHRRSGRSRRGRCALRRLPLPRSALSGRFALHQLVDERLVGGLGPVKLTGLEQVVVVVAVVDGDLTGLHLDDTVRDAADEVAVVRDEQDGALEAVERLLKHVGAGDVQVVGGLVEAQQRLGRHQHLRQRKAALLAAGEHADLLLNGIALEQEGAEQASHLADVPARRHVVELLEHGVARVQLLQLVLRVVRERHVHAVVDGAGIGLHDACDHLHERGFTRAVGADERHLVAAIHGEVEVVVDAFVAERLHQAAAAHHLVAGARRLHEVEVDGLLLLGDLDELLFQALQALRALLGLAGLGGLVAEALDEVLQMLHLLELLGALLAQALDTLLARLKVRGIVALVQVDAAVCHLGHAVDHVVHELAVVADHDDGALVAAQKALEPLHRLKIQVVCGLVEHEHLGVADQKLGQRDAHLPAAGEVRGGLLDVAFLEAQAEQHAADLCLDGVAAQHLVGVARAAGGGKLALGGVVAQRLLQLAQALLGFQDLHLRGHDLLEDGAIGHLDGFLLQVAYAGTPCEQDAPLVGVLAAADDVEHGGFAGAVGAHERQAVVFLQLERDVGEQRAPAERLRQMLNLHDHGATTPLALKRTDAKAASSPHREMSAKTDAPAERAIDAPTDGETDAPTAGENERPADGGIRSGESVQTKKEPPTCAGGSWSFMAPRVGFEPTTLRLTAGCSAVELPRNFFGALRFLGARKYYRHFNFRRNPLFQKFFQPPISGAWRLICSLIRTPWFRYRTQPDMYG